MSKVVDVTNATFENEVRATSAPVLVDFWTTPCPPCERVAPWLEEFAVELGDAVKIVKACIDDNSDAIAKFNVRGAPCFLVFRNGDVVARQPGLPDRTTLLAWIRHAIDDTPYRASDFEWMRSTV